MVGAMAMPSGFRYRQVAARGRPHHHRYDDFRIRHPEMKLEKRAKIFSPFDALKGFSEAVAEKEVQYVARRVLAEEEQEELDRKLQLLRRLTFHEWGTHVVGPEVSVTYYVPCSDRNHSAYGCQGSYVTVSGRCRRADARFLLIGDAMIPTEDVTAIEGDVPEFDEVWEEEAP